MPYVAIIFLALGVSGHCSSGSSLPGPMIFSISNRALAKSTPIFMSVFAAIPLFSNKIPISSCSEPIKLCLVLCDSSFARTGKFF